MKQVLGKKFRILLRVLCATAVIVLTTLYVFPEIATRVPHPMHLRSTVLAVRGEQYHINMTQIVKLNVDERGYVLRGYDVCLLSTSAQFTIVRELPDHYKHYNERDTTWVLLENKLSYKPVDATPDDSQHLTVRTFHHPALGVTFDVILPMLNADPEWVALKDNQGSWLFALSGSNWKYGCPTYLGLIEVRPFKFRNRSA